MCGGGGVASGLPACLAGERGCLVERAVHRIAGPAYPRSPLHKVGHANHTYTAAYSVQPRGPHGHCAWRPRLDVFRQRDERQLYQSIIAKRERWTTPRHRGAPPEGEVWKIVDSKFCLLGALQRYGVMRPDELADVEVMLAEFPSMCIAYIHEEKRADGGITFYSCLVDGKCEAEFDEEGKPTGRRRARYKVELPGHPILGNGKSDNQNHAIIFTRGNILQAIDANQEGYLEDLFPHL